MLERFINLHIDNRRHVINHAKDRCFVLYFDVVLILAYNGVFVFHHMSFIVNNFLKEIPSKHLLPIIIP